jgi:hypothetical protein
MTFVVLALVLGIFSKWPRELLFVIAIGYLISGPLLKLWSIAFPAKPTPGEQLEPVESP